jgi:hypothetical protein
MGKGVGQASKGDDLEFGGACAMAGSSGLHCARRAACSSYGLGPFILINALKEFKAHY